MQIVFDTSALIRFFTNDIPEKSEKVEKLIELERKIIIPDVVFPELEYVLTSEYSLPRNKIIETYRFLLAQTHIKTSPYIKKALIIFENSSLDMADSIIAAQSLNGELASFDQDLLRVKQIKPFWKWL